MDAAFPLWLSVLGRARALIKGKQGRADSGLISQAGLLLIRDLYLTGSSLSPIRLYFLSIKVLYDVIHLCCAGAHRNDLNNVSMIS